MTKNQIRVVQNTGGIGAVNTRRPFYSGHQGGQTRCNVAFTVRSKAYTSTLCPPTKSLRPLQHAFNTLRPLRSSSKSNSKEDKQGSNGRRNWTSSVPGGISDIANSRVATNSCSRSFRTRPSQDTARMEFPQQANCNDKWRCQDHPSATTSSYRSLPLYGDCAGAGRPTWTRYRHSLELPLAISRRERRYNWPLSRLQDTGDPQKYPWRNWQTLTRKLPNRGQTHVPK